MALVIVESPVLTEAQQTKVGTRIGKALKMAGVAHSVVYFQPEHGTLFLDGLVVKDKEEPETTTINPTPVQALPPVKEVDFRDKPRRTHEELESIKMSLVHLIKQKKAISSFDAQEALHLKECHWAPATLRRLFGELEEQHLIAKTGHKRGTKYAFVG